MAPKIFVFVFLLVTFSTAVLKGQSLNPKERICGKWESTEKQLIITITLQNNQYKAIIDWFSDTDGKPLDYWKDVHNPNPELRNRKILGMSILSNLTYHPDTRSWEDGTIYDSKHGKEWNAAAYIGNKGLLHVRGYWHFKFMGKTLTFFRI